jgi:hypothetical protein
VRYRQPLALLEHRPRKVQGHLRSQNDPRLHFGLGKDKAYERIEVQWPGGRREVFKGGPANQSIVLKQGMGEAR